MAKRRTTPEERVAEEILALFEDGGEVTLLTEGRSVYGDEGVLGLRLVACSLARALGLDGGPPGPAPSPDKAAAERLARVRRRLAALAEESGVWFIACFRVAGTADRGLAYSSDLTLREAVEEMVRFVQYGMLLDY